MRIQIHGIAQDSIVDGPGLRLAVFVQGCARGCDGCHNPDSQPKYGGYSARVADIMEKVSPITTGLTISGGEPFDQDVTCFVLAWVAHDIGLDVWAYTGYTFEELLERDSLLLKEVDVLVDGPFVKELQSYALKWRGSSNQRIIDVKKSLKRGEVVLWES